MINNDRYPTTRPKPKVTSDQISQQVNDYLAQGGKITVLDSYARRGEISHDEYIKRRGRVAFDQKKRA